MYTCHHRYNVIRYNVKTVITYAVAVRSPEICVDNVTSGGFFNFLFLFSFFFLVDCVCWLAYWEIGLFQQMHMLWATNTIPTQAGKGFRMTYFEIFCQHWKNGYILVDYTMLANLRFSEQRCVKTDITYFWVFYQHYVVAINRYYAIWSVFAKNYVIPV